MSDSILSMISQRAPASSVVPRLEHVFKKMTTTQAQSKLLDYLVYSVQYDNKQFFDHLVAVGLKKGSAPVRAVLQDSNIFVQAALAAIHRRQNDMFDHCLSYIKDPQHNDSILFRHAFECNNEYVIEKLWNTSNHQAGRCYALNHMSRHGNIKWVQRLIPVSDCNIDDGLPLRTAMLQLIKNNKNKDCAKFEQVVKELIPHTDVSLCLKAFHRSMQIKKGQNDVEGVERFSVAVSYLENLTITKELLHNDLNGASSQQKKKM